MTDWISHNGGPQPVDDDVWICTDAMPAEMEEVGAGYVRLAKQIGEWKHVTGFFVLNQHLIDAKQAEIDALRDDLETWQSVFPHVMPDRLKSDQQLAEENVAAKIDAARLEGIRLGLEAAVKACQEQAESFLLPSYAVDQPLSSVQERFACGQCADGIRALDPDTIAKEAQRDS